MNGVEAEVQALPMTLIHSYQEPEDFEDDALIVVLAEAVSGKRASPQEIEKEQNSIVQEIMMSAAPTVISKESRLYEFRWPQFISFSVMDELRGCRDLGVHTGRWFQRFSESPLLDYARSSLFLFDDRPLIHTRVLAIDRIVDVVAEMEPSIQRVR